RAAVLDENVLVFELRLREGVGELRVPLEAFVFEVRVRRGHRRLIASRQSARTSRRVSTKNREVSARPSATSPTVRPYQRPTAPRSSSNASRHPIGKPITQ